MDGVDRGPATSNESATTIYSNKIGINDNEQRQQQHENGPDRRRDGLLHIGSAVVAEAVRQDHDVIAISRSPAEEGQFEGAEVVVADVTQPTSIAKAFNRKVDVVISTLACRSGLPHDSENLYLGGTVHSRKFLN